MENRKEIIKKFRSMVDRGQHASRVTLLAYAYLRGIPYVALERTINEDKSEGKFTFIKSLAGSVSWQICEIEFGKTYLEAEKPEKEKLLAQQKVVFQEIFNWMNEKYKEIAEVAA